MTGITISDKEENFIMDIENTLTTIKSLYFTMNKGIFIKYYDQLLKLTQVGLVGENPHLDLSKKALSQLKSDIVDKESGSIKNKYLFRLGRKVIIYFFVFFIIFKFLNHSYESSNLDYKTFSNFSLLLCGTFIGVWISSTISKTQLKFEDLITIDSNQLIPDLRLIFTGLISIIFGLLLFKGIISIKLSNFAFEDFYNDSITSLLLGLIMGLNERIIGSSLIKRVDTIFDSK